MAVSTTCTFAAYAHATNRRFPSGVMTMPDGPSAVGIVLMRSPVAASRINTAFVPGSDTTTRVPSGVNFSRFASFAAIGIVRATVPLFGSITLMVAGSPRLATPATHKAEPSGARSIPSGPRVTAICLTVTSPGRARATTLTLLLPMFAV